MGRRCLLPSVNYPGPKQTPIKKTFVNLIHFTSKADVVKNERFRLTDLDFLGIERVDFTLEAPQSSLDPVGPSEHLSCLLLDAQKDVAGVPGKVRKLVNQTGQRVTGDIVQSREQDGSPQPASPLLLRRSPAVSSRQPTHAPRLDASLVKRHVLLQTIKLLDNHKLRAKSQMFKRSSGYVAFHVEGIYILLIPPYSFCFPKHGISCCCPLETLPPRDYSNLARQRASREGKNARGKVGKEQIKTRKISQPPVETGIGASGVHLNRLTHASERGCRV